MLNTNFIFSQNHLKVMGRLLAENERKSTIAAITASSSSGAEGTGHDDDAPTGTKSSENQNEQQSTNNDINVNLQQIGIISTGE